MGRKEEVEWGWMFDVEGLQKQMLRGMHSQAAFQKFPFISLCQICPELTISKRIKAANMSGFVLDFYPGTLNMLERFKLQTTIQHKGWKTFSVKGQVTNILGFVDLMVSFAALSLQCENSHEKYVMNGHGYMPIKLQLRNQAVGQIQQPLSQCLILSSAVLNAPNPQPTGAY